MGILQRSISVARTGLVAIVVLASFASVGWSAPRPTVRTRVMEARTRPQELAGRGALARIGQTSSIASVFSACGSWATLSPDASAFTRDEHMMIYDPVRDRLLIFGGFDGVAIALTNEVWTVPLTGPPVLTQLATSGTPPTARELGSAIYDPVRDRMVIFGGVVSAGLMNDVWELSLSGTPTWSQIVPTGTPPSERYEHSAIYDATRDRMVAFGGYDYTTGDLNDVWALTFSGTPTWTLMSPSGGPPEPRDSHSAVYDGPRDRMVVFGGYVPSTPDGEANDAWALSLAGSGSWSQINPGGGPPPTRYGHTAIVDAPRNRMIVYGGFSSLEPYTLGDVWTLSFTNPIRWRQLNPTGPSPLPASYFSSVYDPVRQRMISFSADEFWTLGGLAGTPGWSMLIPPGQIPRQRWGAAVVYDSPRQRMLMFGGYVYPENIETNDLWEYSLSGGGSWARIVPSGAFPAARTQGTVIYDPVGNRLILFGGTGDLGQLADTWQLSLGGAPTWTQLAPTGTSPSPRYAHTTILDAPRNQMVVYGGYSGSALSDVWTLSLAGGTAWSQLSPTGEAAPAVGYHAAVFDASSNRMLAIGGNGGSSTVWALSLAGPPAWSTLTTAGTPPPWLRAHTAGYDAVRDRMLVGMGDPNLNATYALSLSGTPTWGALGSVTPLPEGRSLTASLYDTSSDRWVVFGGIDYSPGPGTRNDVVALSFPATYPLNVSVTPVVGGTVQQDPAGECQAAGALVTLTAVPAANYAFIGWSGDASGTTNPLTVTMDAAKNITANFENYALNVSVAPVGAGTVAKNPNLPFYPPNSDVTLTATAATGYGFTHWSGDATGSTNPLTVTMTSSKNITANFVGYPVNVTVSPAGSGTVSKNPNQATYAPGSSVTLTASGAYPFLAWSGDTTGTTNPLVITVNGPKNITASFEAYSLTTAVAPAGGGTVTKTPNQTVYGPGSNVTVTATAAVGYLFASWTGDLTGTTNPATVLMNGNKAVTANFITPPPACGSWSLIPVTTKPLGREGSVAIWDPVRHRMVIYGGKGDSSFPLGDVWALTTAGSPAWAQLWGGSGGRMYSLGVYDPVRDRLIIYGGTAGLNYLGDVWAFDLAGTPAWTPITPSGTPPAARSGASLIYDPVRDRLLLFGGTVKCGSTCFTPQNDIWELSLAGTPTWSQLAPAGTPPPPGSGHGAIYDPVRDRMVIVSGFAAPTGARALSLAGTPTWSDLTPIGAPHINYGFGVAYDAVRDRVVVVGVDPIKASALVFEGLPNQALWARHTPGGPSIGQRYNPAVIYEPDQELLIVFGGGGAGIYHDTAMRLDCSGGFWLHAGGTNGTVNGYPSKPCFGIDETVTLQAVGDSGYGFVQWLGDASGTSPSIDVIMNDHKSIVAQFQPGVIGVEEPPLSLSFALEEIRPNPNPGRVQVAYSLPQAAHVRLGIYDLAGRRVSSLVNGEREAGRHSVPWNGEVEGRPARSGVYLVRYESPAGTQVRRLVLLR